MKTREYELDFLKIIGTILIMFHHYQQDSKVFFDGGINFYGGRFSFGLVVELFFILSGYFMYDYIEKIEDGYSFSSFYIKRLLRFLPLLFASAVFYEFVVVMYGRIYMVPWQSIPPTFWGIIITSLGIQEGWSLTNPCINNPMWYISVLMLCYVIFYFLVYISKRLDLKVQYLFIIMILIGMGIDNFGISMPFLNAASSRGYYAFFFGLLFAEVLRKHEITSLETLFCFIMIAGLTFLIVYENDFMSNGLNYIMTFVYYPAVIIICKSKVGRILKHPIIGLMGKISFDVYVWHNSVNVLLFIVIKLFNIQYNLNTVAMMLIYALSSIVVGIISYVLIDKPATALIKRKVTCFS